MSNIIVLPKGIARPIGTKPDEVFTTKITVTSKMAEEWLKKNKNNRPISQTHVRFLVREFTPEKWQLNGESIKFDEHANLLDGQHRLTACIEADFSFETYITCGLNNQVFKTIDTGKNRNASDLLGIAGYQNTSLTASLAKIVLEYDGGKFTNLGIAGKHYIDNQDVYTFVESNKNAVLRAVDYTVSAYSASDKIIAPRLIAGFYFLFSRISETDAISFMNQLVLNDGVKLKSPIWVLRKKLVENKSSVAKLPATYICQLIMKTWNYYRNGREVIGILKIGQKEEIKIN